MFFAAVGGEFYQMHRTKIKIKISIISDVYLMCNDEPVGIIIIYLSKAYHTHNPYVPTLHHNRFL